MPVPVNSEPQELNFGGVRPGALGPDITVDPSLPPTAVSFNGGVEIRSAPANANVTAHVTGDTTHFRVRDVILMDWVLEDVDPTELPPGHHGRLPKVKVLEQIAESDGTAPLAVKAGQYVLVRVEYLALSEEGTFAGMLVIEGDTWEPTHVPLSLFLAEVRTTVATAPFVIAQGSQADLAIVVHSLAGPAVDVTFEMSRTQLHTGLSLNSNLVHVDSKEDRPATLTFTADAQAALGVNTIALDQLAFGRRGLLFQAQIVVPAPAPPPTPLVGPYCQFFDPPGSVLVAPRAYGLKSGVGGKTQRTWSASGGVNGVPNIAPVMANALSVWSNGVKRDGVPLLSFQNVPSGGDIIFGAGNLGAPNPVTGTGTLGQTQDQPGDPLGLIGSGSLITFNNNPAFTFVPQQPGRPSLLAVAIHEIGHALGLLHSTNTAAVMTPFNANAENLSAEDVNAIKAIYGWAPQQPLPGIGTEAGPALCACGPVMVLAWRGIGTDHNLYFSVSSDGTNWSPQQSIPGAASSDGPSLAWDGSQLWMAWKGVPGDQGLYFATWSLGGTWSGVSKVNGAGSSAGPSIAIVGGPVLAWKGVDGDSGIYFASFLGSSFGPQNNVGGTGTTDRPAITADPATGVPRMVWKGVDGDHALYTSTFRGLFWQPQELVAWVVAGNGSAGTVGVGRPGSEVGPGLATAAGRLLMVWRGAGADPNLWFTEATPNSAVPGQTIAEWSTQAHVNGFASSNRPAVASFNGNVFLAWKGVVGDHAVYVTHD